jgi:hypothetical protein
LTEAQNVERGRLSRSLLESGRLHQNTEFKGLGTGASHGFIMDLRKPPRMFHHARQRDTIHSSEVTIIVFLRGERLIYVGALDPNETVTQENVISFVLFDLKKHAHNLRERKHAIELSVHMDNSRRHDGQRVVDRMRRNRIIGLDHPPYSPDLSPCDFWLFEVSKHRLTETVSRNGDGVEDFVSSFWSEVDLNNVQL